MQKQRAWANSAAAGVGAGVRVCLVGVRERGGEIRARSRDAVIAEIAIGLI